MKKYHGFVIRADYRLMKDIQDMIRVDNGELISYTSNDSELYIIPRKLWLKVMMFKRLLEKKVK